MVPSRDKPDDDPEGPAEPLSPSIPRFEADANPWGVPLLDVRPLTQTVMSASSDRTEAANSVSYGRDDGREFLDDAPDSPTVTPAALEFRRDRVFADGVLYAPQTMDFKWAIFHHERRILFVRSWRRRVVMTADVEQDGDVVRVGPIRGTPLDAMGLDPVLVADFVLRSHVLREVLPAPLAPGRVESSIDAARQSFHAFGRLAYYATEDALPPSRPARPLRSSSLLHIAAARGDAASVAQRLDDGLPFDLRDGDGETPLHWALAARDRAVLELLLSRDVPIDLPAEDGGTALMRASEHPAHPHLEWLLERGADANARDARGFTALHRAAEMGHLDVAVALLRAGADPHVEAHGHTPRSLAEGRGHREIVAKLRSR